ncbi:Meiosis protein 5 [Nakaseomyces bracarensis]|uniref:Meiosis protein 5 n=1 Tax=Nakaseomyces bracarensis TaxID=273131 RepID=A0ABR4NU18_9SACH
MGSDFDNTTLVDDEELRTVFVTKKVGKLACNQGKLGSKYLLQEVRREIRSQEGEIRELKQAIRIIEENKLAKLQSLVQKWRTVSQKTMSYLHYSTLQKIEKMGGFERYREIEMEQKKRDVEVEVLRYEEEMESFLESNDFSTLNEEDQIEYREQVESKMEELENMKEKKLLQIDTEFEDKTTSFTMKELAQILKVQYNLVFPE